MKTWAKMSVMGLLLLGALAGTGCDNTDIMMRSAQRGNKWAMRDIAQWYRHGSNGLPKDPELALYWMERSASEGLQDAIQSMASHCIRVGEFTKAREWIWKCKNDEDARLLVRTFAPTLVGDVIGPQKRELSEALTAEAKAIYAEMMAAEVGSPEEADSLQEKRDIAMILMVKEVGAEAEAALRKIAEQRAATLASFTPERITETIQHLLTEGRYKGTWQTTEVLERTLENNVVTVKMRGTYSLPYGEEAYTASSVSSGDTKVSTGGSYALYNVIYPAGTPMDCVYRESLTGGTNAKTLTIEGASNCFVRSLSRPTFLPDTIAWHAFQAYAARMIAVSEQIDRDEAERKSLNQALREVRRDKEKKASLQALIKNLNARIKSNQKALVEARRTLGDYLEEQGKKFVETPITAPLTFGEVH